MDALMIMEFLASLLPIIFALHYSWKYYRITMRKRRIRNMEIPYYGSQTIKGK